MSASLRALLDGLIDYAGLFPPAALPMDAAVAVYFRHRGEPEAWMLGRFVVPAVRLGELEAAAGPHLGRTEEPLRMTLLAGGGESAEASLAAAREHARAARQFTASNAGAAFEAVETRFPADLLAQGEMGALRRYAGAFQQALADEGLRTPPVFFETSTGAAPASVDASAIEALAGTGAGFKLRCGGTEPAAVPPVERVAAAIAGCRDRGVPLKCTAGLHHPVRRHDPALGARIHGFLNVFGGAVLAAARDLPLITIEACVADEEAAHFSALGGTFSWNGFSASADEVRRARRDFATGFGSCSFDEPVSDLRALRLLPS